MSLSLPPPLSRPHKQMLFSVLTRKHKVPRHNFHPPRSRSFLIRRGSPLRPVTLSVSIHPALSLAPPARAQAQMKRQILAGSAFGVRFPGPTQKSSLREQGTQDPNGPQAPQATQTRGWGGVCRVLQTATHADCYCH